MADNNLPPGFRFYPTDEELVVHFLHRKDGYLPFNPDVIPDLDVYPYSPWELQGTNLYSLSLLFIFEVTRSNIYEAIYIRFLSQTIE